MTGTHLLLAYLMTLGYWAKNENTIKKKKKL
jgi:hypothetical protein